ncbi:MAG: ArsR/SmtB family transcription factor [Akkermansiaceae bacterium]
MSALLNDRVSVIKALAHPTRLLVAEFLRDGPCCVSDIHQHVGGDLSTVSKHLTIMREAGWLTSEKEGLHIHYQLSCSCLDDFLRCVDTLADNPSSCC